MLRPGPGLLRIILGLFRALLVIRFRKQVRALMIFLLNLFNIYYMYLAYVRINLHFYFYPILLLK